MAIRRLPKSTISKSLLYKVIYKMLPFLQTIQGLFQYYQHLSIRPHSICRLFSIDRYVSTSISINAAVR